MGLVRSALTSRPVKALTSPHTVDHYLDQVHPMMTVELVRARVVDVIRETDVATTVVLRPNGAWRGFRPGQHVEFGIEVDGTRKVRVFSVSCAAGKRQGTISVSVKAHEDGYVSRFLNSELARRTVVHLSQATGDFVLPDAVPDEIALVSGGSGITPVMSMARTLRDRGHRGKVTFLHYAKSRRDEMFSTELDTLAEQLPDAQVVRVYTREPEPAAALAGRFHVDHLKHLGVDPTTVPTWVCGPAGLIASVRETYDELDATDLLHTEYFKVPTVDPALLEQSADEAVGTLAFEESDTSVDNSGATILEQAESAGLTPDFGCRMGVCNTCAVKKLGGAVRHVISGEVCANTDETIKVCVNVPVGDVSVAL
ncbi:ferredoxin reductase [Aeromicrobium sp. CTD01-1L150]|uniref:ferredoxin reductase n=1 Tax=Aeromicrobium sp. CTD01-1L150 TaxID=3341830 RepID=UPI0035BEE0CB